MRKEQLAELLENVAMNGIQEEKRFYFPREEQLREPSVTVRFSVKLNADGKVMFVSRTCNLSCSCEKCPFRGLCDDIEERIRA